MRVCRKGLRKASVRNTARLTIWQLHGCDGTMNKCHRWIPAKDARNETTSIRFAEEGLRVLDEAIAVGQHVRQPAAVRCH